jgi:hypothetical protein
MNLKNAICQKFERLINNDIAAGQQCDFVLVNGLKEHKVTDSGKKYLGVPVEIPTTLYDMVKPSVDVLSKLRFIYLLSQLEAFGKEYIALRDGVSPDSVSSHISATKSAWQRQEDGRRASTSLYNTPFLAFVLATKYSISFDSDISPGFWQVGPLRSCLVHHQGVIVDETYRSDLQEVIAVLGTTNAVGERIMIEDKLMWSFIHDSRRFLSSCDF